MTTIGEQEELADKYRTMYFDAVKRIKELEKENETFELLKEVIRKFNA
jgi:hypothetical protein